MNLGINVSLLVIPRTMRYSTLETVLNTSLKVLSGCRYVELMVSISEMVVLIPPTSSVACCITHEAGTGGCFLAASISSRTRVTGATAWSTVLVGSGGYFVDERSATTVLDKHGNRFSYLVGLYNLG